jgi:hypothetical protein
LVIVVAVRAAQVDRPGAGAWVVVGTSADVSPQPAGMTSGLSGRVVRFGALIPSVLFKMHVHGCERGA